MVALNPYAVKTSFCTNVRANSLVFYLFYYILGQKRLPICSRSESVRRFRSPCWECAGLLRSIFMYVSQCVSLVRRWQHAWLSLTIGLLLSGSLLVSCSGLSIGSSFTPTAAPTPS